MGILGNIECVKCNLCGTIHAVNTDKKQYFRVDGNITIGEGGGLIGNNFDAEGKLRDSFIFCNSRDCIMKFFKIIDIDQYVILKTTNF